MNEPKKTRKPVQWTCAADCERCMGTGFVRYKDFAAEFSAAIRGVAGPELCRCVAAAELVDAEKTGET